MLEYSYNDGTEFECGEGAEDEVNKIVDDMESLRMRLEATLNDNLKLFAEIVSLLPRA